MYWNVNSVQGYNCLFNFIIGGRGTGKTYGMKKWCITDFKKTGAQFIYVRRFQTEVDKVKGNFWNDIGKEFEDYELKVDGDKFYIDGELAGWVYSLTTAKILKSNSFPDVNKVIFDEFLIDKGQYTTYIKDEVIAFLELYETVARMRDNVKAFFLANPTTITNPYFSYFNIKSPHVKKNEKGEVVEGKIERVAEDILIEVVAEKNFIEAKKNTRFGRLIENTQYGKYAIESVFLRDNNDFIVEDLPKKIEQKFLIKWQGKVYGVWGGGDNFFYITYKHNPNTKLILTFTTEDHQEDTLLMRSNSFFVRALRQRFDHNLIRFESVNIKNEVLPLLEKVR